ncbi:hypothetical protein HYT02_04820 [Candidatus Gottesmanbacteria bacterium]|nr:hypothetical protein [Candidatus Gottesmanbacteria bacterium]
MFGGSGVRLVSIIVGILFVLGLIVLANRFGGQIRERLQTRIADTTSTPTPQPSISPVEQVTFGDISGESTTTKGGLTYQGNQVSEIPDTGAETLLIPGLISLFGIGLKLRKSA